MHKKKLTLGHSPDSDDAFMFYAMAKGLIDMDGFAFEHILKDIQTLNEWSLEGRLDITAISFYAYTRVYDKYAILSSGASVGDDYGPMVVTAEPMTVEDLKNVTIAVPGEMTTAFLTLRLALGTMAYRVMPFDTIIDAVTSGEVKAGLIIHEGQLTYSQHKLHCVIDLGTWWKGETGLPLPLGCNVIRRELGLPTMQKAAKILKASIEYALAHRRDALDYALGFTPNMEKELGDKFVSMYVNDLTLELGDRGRAGVNELLRRSAAAGLSDWPVEKEAEFVY
ncbi:MAG: MqnA/MqnD/SBP family protein [Sedimentisphaerales bacterium]|nr:MqnA/MqnD/SBP family protein [Sedimentisphaerales bacterium]